MNKTLRKTKGFTLIELVVVIVIIGILSAIAVPVFYDMSSKADTAADEQSMGAVRTAWAFLYAKNSTYPSVTALAGQVIATGTKATGAATGVTLASGSIILTYTDDDCGTATTDAADLVQCIGDIG